MADEDRAYRDAMRQAKQAPWLKPLVDRIAELEARLAQANEALTFYRDAWQWDADDPGVGGRVPGETYSAWLEPNDALMADKGERAKAALSPTPPAQSAGEALDPAGTGEGATPEVDWHKAIATAFYEGAKRLWPKRRLPYAASLLSVQYADEVAPALIRAQASALAEARRSALEEAAELVEGFDVAPTGEDVRSDVALALVRRDLALAEAIRALTAPQHGNG